MTLSLQESVLHKNHNDMLAISDNPSRILYIERKFEDAEELHRRILALQESFLGSQCPVTSTNIDKLAIGSNRKVCS